MMSSTAVLSQLVNEHTIFGDELRNAAHTASDSPIAEKNAVRDRPMSAPKRYSFSIQVRKFKGTGKIEECVVVRWKGFH